MVTTHSNERHGLTASAVMAASAVPAAGEVYLNEAQALAIVLGEKSGRAERAKDSRRFAEDQTGAFQQFSFPESSTPSLLPGKPEKPRNMQSNE